jgi:aminoglycoside/choline kinase family phosphotransferase
MQTNTQDIVLKLFKTYSGQLPAQIQALPVSGSYRQYFRIALNGNTFIGAYNHDVRENNAFLSFTRTFLNQGLPVPKLLAVNDDATAYIIEDLGDMTLLSFIASHNDNVAAPEVIKMYKKVLAKLPLFQVKAGTSLDYSQCYPRQAFDRQSMMWDLNYFKYYFLRLAKVPFDEQLLEDDFEKLCNFLLLADTKHFMYRDFQSRNVMIVNDEPHFIDYQGGRRGALQYDPASILFESKTSLPPVVREELYNHYIDSLQKIIKINPDVFSKHYYGYVYIRLMQAMGAYGFRGLYEKKELFLQSIPKALDHLKWLLDKAPLSIDVTELNKVFRYLVQSDYIRHLAVKATQLQVTLNSFSYKRGIPIDETPHGGGYVFDCRALRNPGKFDEYKTLTGKGVEVQKFFAGDRDMEQFIHNAYALVEASVKKYKQRGFTSLMVSFGCTGGQHRSVYAAETLNKLIASNHPDVHVHIRHRELETMTAR